MEKQFLDFAISLAREAGEIMKQNFSLAMKKEWKHDHTPVTATDLEINKLVLERIKAKFPDHDVIGEEGSSQSSGSEYVWVCDPVDGTHNFAHGIPTATFLLALVYKDAGLVSVIYDPFMDRMFYAQKGEGAFLNGNPISVSDSRSITKTLVGLGKWNSACNLFPVSQEMHKRNTRMITGLSIGYMGALVAVGEFSATLFGGGSIYDNLSVRILVEEAGGKVTNLFGEVEGFLDEVKGQLVSNGLVHDEILEIIKNHSDNI